MEKICKILQQNVFLKVFKPFLFLICRFSASVLKFSKILHKLGNVCIFYMKFACEKMIFLKILKNAARCVFGRENRRWSSRERAFWNGHIQPWHRRQYTESQTQRAPAASSDSTSRTSAVGRPAPRTPAGARTFSGSVHAERVNFTALDLGWIDASECESNRVFNIFSEILLFTPSFVGNSFCMFCNFFSSNI